VQSQLDALQRKAAYRAAKHAASAAAASPAVKCNAPPHGADVSQPSSASGGAPSTGMHQHADGSAPQPRPRHAAAHRAAAQQHEQAAPSGLGGAAAGPAVQQERQPQTSQQPATHLPAQPAPALQRGEHSQRPHEPHFAEPQPQRHSQDESHAAVPLPSAESAAWLDALWEEAQRDVAAMDGDAGPAMRDQQDWLLLNGYESDWYSLQALTFVVIAGSCCSAQHSCALTCRLHAFALQTAGGMRKILQRWSIWSCWPS
jgi:hypothetical protein